MDVSNSTKKTRTSSICLEIRPHLIYWQVSTMLSFLCHPGRPIFVPSKQKQKLKFFENYRQPFRIVNYYFLLHHCKLCYKMSIFIRPHIHRNRATERETEREKERTSGKATNSFRLPPEIERRRLAYLFNKKLLESGLNVAKQNRN